MLYTIDIMPYTEVTELSELYDVYENNTVVITYFYATWCKPCVVGAPIFQTISDMEEYASYKFIKVNVGDHKDIKTAMNVSTIPLVTAVVEGGEMTRHVGMTESNMAKILDQCPQMQMEDKKEDEVPTAEVEPPADMEEDEN